MSSGPESSHLVADLVTLAAARDGARPALVEASGRTLTWADLDGEVGRVATGLGAVGMVAGQRVLLVLDNRLELVTTYLAALRAQLVAVPVNPRAKDDELAWMIADSGARLVVADAATVADARAARAVVREALDSARDVLDDEVVSRAREPRIVVVDSEVQPGEIAFDAIRSAEPSTGPARPDPETLACLLYTGSSVDLPRAAMLTHRALLANIEQAAAVDPPTMRPDDIVLGVLPLFHVYGLNAVLGACCAGAPPSCSPTTSTRAALSTSWPSTASRSCRWLRPCSRTGWACRTWPRPSAPCGSSCPDPRRWPGPSSTSSPRGPAYPSTRGTD
jgi:long-chain acyl-CoA synthetase